ncbi:MAG: hypothetical protein ACI32N_02400 [Bulleidia sp.]
MEKKRTQKPLHAYPQLFDGVEKPDIQDVVGKLAVQMKTLSHVIQLMEQYGNGEIFPCI